MESAYAGVTVSPVDVSPGDLQFAIEHHGYAPQPNEFVSETIRTELETNGTSATWNGLYGEAVAGHAIPPPYFGADQTDPVAANAMRDTYHAIMSGTLPRDRMPDPRSIVSPDALAAMSIRPKAGLDGRGILIHMCSQCHNSRLDQTLTRAHFNATDLDAMPALERQLAIIRLQLPDDDPHKMPPPRFRVLSDAERDLAIAALGPP